MDNNVTGKRLLARYTSNVFDTMNLCDFFNVEKNKIKILTMKLILMIKEMELKFSQISMKHSIELLLICF